MSVEQLEQLLHIRDAHHLHLACQRRLFLVGVRHIQPRDAKFRAGPGHGQRPFDWTQLARHGQLPDKGILRRLLGQQIAGAQQCQQHRKIVNGRVFDRIGRGQVDRDAPLGVAEIAVAQAGAHALPALLDRCARQSHNLKPVPILHKIGLHGDAIAEKALQPEAGHCCEHDISS